LKEEETMKLKAWEGVIVMPGGERTSKPRSSGLTMVIDKGLGLGQIEDLASTSGSYIDVVKLTFGTSAFYDTELLKKKNRLLAAAGIEVMPGGTFLEVAFWQRVAEAYLERALNLGFSAIEVSDGTIELPRSERARLIRLARDLGFKVISEVGKKDPQEALPFPLLHELVQEDLENGAFKVIIEAREAGKGVGIFDGQGWTRMDEVDRILEGVRGVDDLIWEAPLKNQQQDLILRFGPDVNLGNIPPEEVLALEALRQGVRGDTLKKAYQKKKDWKP
jgi:phosphosulfolactate synthase